MEPAPWICGAFHQPNFLMNVKENHVSNLLNVHYYFSGPNSHYNEIQAKERLRIESNESKIPRIQTKTSDFWTFPCRWPKIELISFLSKFAPIMFLFISVNSKLNLESIFSSFPSHAIIRVFTTVKKIFSLNWSWKNQNTFLIEFLYQFL